MTRPDILFFAGIDWEGRNTMPCHHVARGLARSGPVHYVDNFGTFRNLDRHDFRRAADRLRQVLSQRGEAGGSRAGGHPPGGHPENIRVARPLVVPVPGGERLQRVNGRLLAHQLKRHGFRPDPPPILWARTPIAAVWHCSRSIPHSLLIYQCIDKFPEHPRIGEKARAFHRPWEKRFNREADLVFCSARGLYEEKKKLNPQCHFFPNGASEIFRTAGRPPGPPGDGGRRPIVGFAGAIGASLDIPLLARIAAARPGMDFVLAGTVDGAVDTGPLRRAANVRLAGRIPHEKLPELFATFDAGLLCYPQTRFQQFTFPAKLAEYLLAGLPVVSNPIPELEPYRGVVHLAEGGADGMARALDLAVAERVDPALERRRREVGDSLSWSRIVAGMEDVIARALAARRGDAGPCR